MMELSCIVLKVLISRNRIITNLTSSFNYLHEFINDFKSMFSGLMFDYISENSKYKII